MEKINEVIRAPNKMKPFTVSFVRYALSLNINI
jgi:hypothetical protein